MQVFSKRQGRPRRDRCSTFGAALIWALAGLAGFAHAGGFNEKVRAPAMKDGAELRARAQGMATRLVEIRESAPARLITDTSLARQHFDLKWQVQHAINERKPLDDFAQLGLISRGDGSYGIDSEAHPEWDDLPAILLAILTDENLDNVAPALLERGFRPADIESLRSYIVSHDAVAIGAAAGLPISLGFGRMVRRYDKLKLPIPDSAVMSFFYQRALVEDQAKHAWAEGLLGQLDAQRQRILLSAFLEITPETIWAPDNLPEGIADTLAQVRQPNFEKRVTAEARGVAP